MSPNVQRLPSDKIYQTLNQLFLQYGFSPDNAHILAQTFTHSSLDGIASHGLNRVPRFIDYIEKQKINIHATAQKIEGLGSIERWDGQFGAGILNATNCTRRAIGLAKKYGMGLVALRNTNHWMRGGTYGWQMAEADCIGLLFTNTTPNMPVWGGQEARLGNNPLIIAIPRPDGPIVLDMAMSQYSFGKIHSYQLKNENLPYYGGWNENNELSKNPSEILKVERGLPIGFWKGSSLSMILDLLATALAAGQSTYRIGQEEMETGLSQIFLTIDPYRFNDQDLIQQLMQETIDYIHQSTPMKKGQKTYYPGEQTLQRRKENIEKGIPVNNEIWQKICAKII